MSEVNDTVLGEPNDALDCLTCGACCKGRSGTVLVTPHDLLRFRDHGRPDIEQSLVLGHFDLAALPVGDDDCCSYLEHDGGRVACSIYAARPESCRNVLVGSPECLAAREQGRRA